MILKIEQGPNTGQSWTVAKPGITIGRDPACDVPLQDERVSHRHARLWQEGEVWWVQDLNSTNGTWINGKRLTGPYRLQPGDQLRLGLTTFSAWYESLPASPDVGARRTAAAREVAQPPAAEVLDHAGSAPHGIRQYRGDIVAWLVDGLIGMAALLLIAGSYLPWIRISVNVPFVGQVTATPAGTEGMGTYTMIGGALSLALVLITVVVRAVVVAHKASPAVKVTRLFLRWSGLGHLLGGSILLLLGLLGLARYYQSANREVFLGIRLIDLFGFAVDWLNLRLIPQTGLILTGLGLGLLLLGASARLAVAFLIEKPVPQVSRERPVLKLVLQQDGQPNLEFAVVDGVTVGRGEDNDIVVRDNLASRHHAEIRWWVDGYVVVDRESTNGVLVNGQRIAAPHRIQPGDRIQIGQAVLVVGI